MNSYICLLGLKHQIEGERAEIKRLEGGILEAKRRIETLGLAIQIITTENVKAGMNEEGLYRCKVCDGRPQFCAWSDHNNDSHYSIRCSECDSAIDYDGDKEDGITSWNIKNKK